MTNHISLRARSLLLSCYFLIYKNICLAIKKHTHRIISIRGNSHKRIVKPPEADYLVHRLALRLLDITTVRNVVAVKVKGVLMWAKAFAY